MVYCWNRDAVGRARTRLAPRSLLLHASPAPASLALLAPRPPASRAPAFGRSLYYRLVETFARCFPGEALLVALDSGSPWARGGVSRAYNELQQGKTRYNEV